MISFDAFVQWAEDRIGPVSVKGNEVRANSIFAADTRFHMWCNPCGGKHQREDGCYRCFKTDRKGTLTGLVMLVDGCDYAEAKELLSGQTNIRVLEERLEAFFANRDEVVPVLPESNIKLPAEAVLISGMSRGSLDRMDAEAYLESRKLPAAGLYYCAAGEYRTRIVIPYYGPDRKLIYFNARHIGKSTLRYMGPPKSIGVGKGDVLYAPTWPDAGSPVHLTEGEFDALSLSASGLNGMACGGKYLSDKQVDLLRPYKVCLTLDNDDAGLAGVIKMGQQLLAAGIPTTFVRPPKGYKDWNLLLVRTSPQVVSGWVQKNAKGFDDYTPTLLLSTGL